MPSKDSFMTGVYDNLFENRSKRVYPRQPMMPGSESDEMIRRRNTSAVKGREAGHESRQGTKMRRLVRTDRDLVITELPDRDRISTTIGFFARLQLSRQVLVKLAMQPTDEIRTKKIHRWLRLDPAHHRPLRENVGTGEMLVRTLGRLGSEITAHRALDVRRERFVALDEVGVIAVHLAYQRCDTLADQRGGQSGLKPSCGAMNIVSQRNQLLMPGGGQERLERGRPRIEFGRHWHEKLKVAQSGFSPVILGL